MMSSYSASDFADLVLDNVGSKFIPAADNVSDFMNPWCVSNSRSIFSVKAKS